MKYQNKSFKFFPNISEEYDKNYDKIFKKNKRRVIIITNKVKCNNCGDIIESKSVHDFNCCSCYVKTDGETGICVDGGKDYLRRIGDIRNYEELSEVKYE